MSSRASLHPNAMHAGTGVSSTNATKQRQLAHLASRLGELGNRLQQLDRQVVIAAGQNERMREFAAMQAALFMAAQRTFVEDDDDARQAASQK